MMRFVKRIPIAGLIASAVVCQTGPAQGVDPRPANDPNQKPAFAGQTDAPERKLNVNFQVVTVADNINTGWAFAFLPNGKMLVTERGGQLLVVGTDGSKSPPVTGLPPVDARGQGGLLDVALDPDFATNSTIYWSFSEPQPEGANNTAVARGRFVDGPAPRVEDVSVIYHQVPAMASRAHFGSRLVFGRDKTLFVTQGDRSFEPGRMQSQDKNSLVGKFVRINRDGSIPADNPFVGQTGVRPEIWTIGHRNAQAAALHPTTGELWTIEHGTRGGDELNIPRKGKDYGWPTIAYGIEYRGGPILGGITAKEGMEQPIYYWDPVIGPSGMAFYTADLFPAWKGSLFVGGHATYDLVRLSLNGDRVVGEERLLKDIEPRPHVRDVRQGPDGALYVLTDSTSGKLLKLVPRR
ncbi:MAG TPA: PQQ-dependent sugar dehydrogenase [Gemmatimonadaceae bacterium]